MSPLVSVILPTYNAGKFIRTSIQSILNQSYPNFELIILDDGSTDDSDEIIASFKDSRIRYYRHDNIGMAGTLNRGIDLAKGELIARQDADDISYPERLGMQVRFLHKNPSIAFLGTQARIITEDGIYTDRYHTHPLQNKTLKLFLLFDNPFVHSSIMVRRSCLVNVGYYDVSKPSLTQDYDLWSRIARKYDIANIGSVLLDYREVHSGISKTDFYNSSYYEKLVAQSVENITCYGIPSYNATILPWIFQGRKPNVRRKENALITVYKAFKQLRDVFNKIDQRSDEYDLLFKQIKSKVVRNAFFLYYPRLFNLVMVIKKVGTRK